LLHYSLKDKCFMEFPPPPLPPNQFWELFYSAPTSSILNVHYHCFPLFSKCPVVPIVSFLKTPPLPPPLAPWDGLTYLILHPLLILKREVKMEPFFPGYFFVRPRLLYLTFTPSPSHSVFLSLPLLSPFPFLYPPMTLLPLNQRGGGVL